MSSDWALERFALICITVFYIYHKLKFLSKILIVVIFSCFKCGTGSLAFLDCHPRIIFETFEPFFFRNNNTIESLENYKNG